jgi:hypothetical protein
LSANWGCAALNHAGELLIEAAVRLEFPVRVCFTRSIGAIGGRCIGTIGVVCPGTLFHRKQRSIPMHSYEHRSQIISNNGGIFLKIQVNSHLLLPSYLDDTLTAALRVSSLRPAVARDRAERHTPGARAPRASSRSHCPMALHAIGPSAADTHV